MAQLNKLSKREWEVVKVLLQGKSNKIIASTLGISERTVEFHLKNFYTKQLGFINPSTMSSEVATTLTTMIMTAIWFVVAVTIGIVLLFVTIQKPEPPVVRSHISENGF